MDIDAFAASAASGTEPQGLSPSLRALWQLRRGDWDAAHRSVQAEDDPAAAWVHAHLHRVEGDLGNAGHWYARAGRPAAVTELDAEWREIAAALLAG